MRPPRRGAILKRRTYIRNVEAGELFEDFLVAAVASIVLIRVYLHLAGYPSIGGTRFHIAHMLPGGALMLVALLLLLGYLGAGIRHVAAVVGGVGFGTFIDELGKFITRDNDYFFEPTAALVYLVFILTWLVFHAARRRPLTPEEAVANALETTLEAVRHDLDRGERARALELLRSAPKDDPVAQALAEALRRIEAVPPRPSPFTRVKGRVEALYGGLARRRWFTGAVFAFFIGHSLLTLLKSVPVVGTPSSLTFFGWGDLVSSAIPGVLVLAGVWHLPRSRLRAYRWFQRAVLFTLFVTQFFAFYHQQFVAAAGLLWNLALFATLRYAIHREERQGALLAGDPGAGADRLE
ncbi:MAG: hypothetical protein ACREKI_06075 [Gemmatimonadota bacterium]